MNCEYFCNKKSFAAGEVEEAQIFFTNGDFFALAKKEIVEVTVKFYDELCVAERGFCPVAKSGFIKCKINNKSRHRGEQLLYKNNEYGKDIKSYLENRCVKEGGIRYVRLFDENHWHVPFYCVAGARKEDDFLILEFQEGASIASADSECHTARVREITKETIEKIDLDFENCDGIEIFQEEILDMQLNFEKELDWGSSAFNRKLHNGFIRFKFDKKITWRRSSVDWVSGKDTLAKIEKRLYGKGRSEIDICHLYVTYNYAGYCMNLEECIQIDDIRPIQDKDEDEWNYISGYAEKQKDGSILIVFGE